MSMFPNAYSQVYYNAEGEVLGWDNPSYDDPPEPDEGDNLYGDQDYDDDDDE